MPYVLLGIAALVSAFVVLMFVTAMCERQYLSGDVEPVSEPYPYAPSPYWQATRDDALRLGMHHAGDFATRKNTSVVKGLQSMWITADRRMICAIIGGSIVGAKLKKTVRRSRLEDGRVIESGDDPGLVDVSRLVDRAVLLNAGLEELMRFHLQRIVSSGSAPVPFKGESVIADYEQVDLEKGARMVDLGLARWVNPQRDVVRMTLRGALAHVTHGLFKDMVKLSAQKDRANIRRAGSRPGT
jgi:hypothetical protein